MKKIAVFVEGQTEQLFVEKILYEIASRRNIQIDFVKLTGGFRYLRRPERVRSFKGPDPAKTFYAMIYDSSGDGRVLSDLRDNYESLSERGFSAIIGIRDIFPVAPADEQKHLELVEMNTPKGSVTATVVSARREIEAWFIAEHTHFTNVDPSLTVDKIGELIGYRPDSHDVEVILNPASDMNTIYNSVNRVYSKSSAGTKFVINHLDYAIICLELHKRVPSLNKLIKVFDDFFDSTLSSPM